MNTEQLDTIQSRADAATEGPWDSIGGDVVQSYDLAIRTGEYSLERVGIIPGEYVRENDAEFIAHARTDVPALLALAREQAATIAAVRDLANGAGRCGWRISADDIRKTLGKP